jgi:hypothetical protein
MNEWKEAIIHTTTTEGNGNYAPEYNSNGKNGWMDDCVANMIMIYTHFHYKHIK